MTDKEISSIVSHTQQIQEDNTTNLEIWREGVRNFIKTTKQAFWDSPDLKERLEWWESQRGLHPETLFVNDIGLFLNDKEVDLSLIGISKKSLIPAGYTIPCFYENEPVYVKIRTFNAAQKYKCLPGSQIKYPYCPGNPNYECDTLVIVEGELDALVLTQEIQSVKTASFGSAGIKWNDNFQNTIQKYKHFYIIPDADDAGYAHAKELMRNIPAKLIKHTKHKDVTEMKLAGVNLTWFLFSCMEGV